MKELMTTDGRIPRSTFWIFIACLYGVLALLSFIKEHFVVPGWFASVVALVMFPVLMMNIIVQIKRWHDLDRSGWWVLINFVPIIGLFCTLVVCGITKGTTGPNRYGPDPLAATLPPPSPPQ